MKTISKFILAILLVSFMTVSCDDMNSIIQDDLDKGEAIYPGRPGYTRAEDVFPGMGRAWVYWAVGSDSRITKTVIEYTFNGETKTVEKNVPVVDDTYLSSYRADSLLITGLDEGYYSFSMYTVDKEGHRSITTPLYPQIVRIYGNVYLNSISSRNIEKMEMLAGGDLKITWMNPASDVLSSLTEYKDYSENPSGTTKVDTILNETDTTLLKGFKRYKTFSVRSRLQVGIDTAEVETFYAPPMFENTILVNNGLAELTDAALEAITTLAYPLGIETWTLQDLYYFPNLHTLDLTPGTEALPEYTYIRTYIDYNSESYQNDTTRYSSTVGGGDWLNFVSGYMRSSDIAIISDLLESGQLTKVKYTRNSYPGLDALLAQYSNKIEWVPAAELPSEIMIPPNLLVNYRTEDRSRGAVTVTHSKDASVVPADIAAKFTGGALNNVYRIGINTYGDNNNQQNANTTAFSLPVGVRFNSKEYKYLKCDVYIQTANSNYNWMLSSSYSKFEGYKTIRFTRQTKLSNFPDTSPYVIKLSGDDGTSPPAYSYTFADNQLPNNETGVSGWRTLSWDMSNEPTSYTVAVTYHGRVLLLKLGMDSPWPITGMTYYIANLRWSK